MKTSFAKSYPKLSRKHCPKNRKIASRTMMKYGPKLRKKAGNLGPMKIAGCIYTLMKLNGMMV